MKSLAVLVVLVCALHAANAQVAWRNCGESTDAAHISRVATFQDTPSGDFVILLIQGNLTKIVGDGQVKVTKFLKDVVVGEDAYPLCDHPRACPMFVGPFAFKRSVLLPPVYERGAIGTLQVEVDVFTFMEDSASAAVYVPTNEKSRMFCVEADFPVQRGRAFN